MGHCQVHTVLAATGGFRPFNYPPLRSRAAKTQACLRDLLLPLRRYYFLEALVLNSAE